MLPQARAVPILLDNCPVISTPEFSCKGFYKRARGARTINSSFVSCNVRYADAARDAEAGRLWARRLSLHSATLPRIAETAAAGERGSCSRGVRRRSMSHEATIAP